MTDSAAVLRCEVDTLIQAQITTLNSAKLRTLHRQPVHERKIFYFCPSV